MNTNTQQLNENHGIAATGLQQPHTAVPPTTYNDKAGTHNPSETNRHAGTGIPPVNTAEHVSRNLDDTTARIGRDAYPPTTGNITNEPVKSYQEAPVVTGNHPTTATGPSVGSHTGGVHDSNVHPTTGTGVHDTNVDPTTGTGIHDKVHPTTGTTGVHDHKVNPTTGVHDNKVHHETAATTGQHPTTSAGVEATKPSVGDKIKGNVEKLAGKITGNEAKIVKGDNIAHGRA